MKPNFRLFKGRVLDLYEIFSTPKKDRRNARPELVTEPLLIDVSLLAVVHAQTKEDIEKHGFKVSGTLCPQGDIISFDEEIKTIREAMESQAHEERKARYFKPCNIYRDAIEDWIPAFVRIDLVPNITPCDLPGDEYKDAEYRGTVLTFKAGHILMTDIDFDSVVPTLCNLSDIKQYKAMIEEIEAQDKAESEQDETEEQ